MKISLKAMRVNAGLNQKEVAKNLGIAPNTLISWEKNNTSPDAVQLSKICELYGCKMDDIFFIDKLAKSEHKRKERLYESRSI